MVREQRNWTSYRERLGLSKADEVDLHFGRRAYDEAMADVEQLVSESLRKAHGRRYVMFTHGHSTSRRGQTTARSVVRGFKRSKDATPFIMKADCVQQPTVFVAKIKRGGGDVRWCPIMRQGDRVDMEPIGFCSVKSYPAQRWNRRLRPIM